MVMGIEEMKRSPLRVDELQQMLDAAVRAGSLPWKVVLDFDGDDWLLCWGEDEVDGAMQKVHICTNRVHASEMVRSGGSVSEARHAVAFDPETSTRLVLQTGNLIELLKALVDPKLRDSATGAAQKYLAKLEPQQHELPLGEDE